MRKLLIGLFACVISYSYSQSNVSGVVEGENGDPIPLASVSVKGANKGVKTDFEGKYSIAVDVTDTLTLVYYATGFVRQEILVAGRAKIDVVLVSEAKELDEVVVVGYGEASSKELTGATSKVDGEDVEKMNLARMDQALQGQVSGVNISTNSGSPGGSSNIRIRGLSTFGNNDPLVLVDGVVYDVAGLNALNPSDIKSINVLKDATAGIYGVRAANGVIIVETKKGKDQPKAKY